MGQAMVVALSEVLALDASIAELADLPLGAKADRESSAKPRYAPKCRKPGKSSNDV